MNSIDEGPFIPSVSLNLTTLTRTAVIAAQTTRSKAIRLHHLKAANHSASIPTKVSFYTAASGGSALFVFDCGVNDCGESRPMYGYVLPPESGLYAECGTTGADVDIDYIATNP